VIAKLRVKNLKTWGEQLWADGLELAPVTLLLGPNSAGKTSLIQLPLLLKQTFDSPDRTLDLNLGGQATDLVDLGSYESLIHHHDTERELGIGLTLSHPGSDRTVDYEATFGLDGGTMVIQQLVLGDGAGRFAATRQGQAGYSLEGPGPAASLPTEPQRRFRPERAVAFSADAVAALGPQGPVVQDLSLQLRHQVERIAYLGPLRQKPERSYLWNGVAPGDIGERGEYAVAALMASDNAPEAPADGSEGGRQWLVQRVSAWLARLGVADELRIERQGNSRHYELVVVRGGQTANIMDVGFGISQVLPMLVLAHLVPPGTTVIAEQPEIHLHPRAQAGLADLLVEVAKERRIQFLIETHSEHLFRRLQFRIADEALSTAECRLYFVDRDEDGASAFVTLDVDDFGRVRNWPKQFFGDAVGETERQTRRMLERLAAKRGGQPG
jgi:predicted ATPase